MLIDYGTVLDPFSFNAGTPLSLTATATPSTNVYDVLGLGVGTVSGTYYNFGYAHFSSAVAGSDMGVGSFPDKPNVIVFIDTTFTTAGNATGLYFSIQASLETEATGAAASWTTIGTSATIPIASLTAGTLYTLPLPEANVLLGGNPRFYRLLYTIVGGSQTFNAGKISSAIVLGDWTPFLGVAVSNNYNDWIA